MPQDLLCMPFDMHQMHQSPTWRTNVFLLRSLTSMGEGNLKAAILITKSPSPIPFYNSCIPGALCTTRSQLNSSQISPPHRSSGQYPPSAVILCLCDTEERALQPLVSAFLDMHVKFISQS